MRLTTIISAITAASSALATVNAATPDWLHIYHKPANGVRSVSTMPLTEQPKLTHGAEADGSYSEVTVTRADGTTMTLPLDKVERVELGTNVPVIEITTDDPDFVEVTDKVNYHEGTLRLTAYGDEASLSMEPLRVRLRGRGNSTMRYEKKPYRLNFANNSEKAKQKPSLLGMKKAKNYVLIANVQDPTLMWNGTAFEIARRLGMEFVNSSVPVWVRINGVDRGAYMLSEKIGINGASVDIDEAQGCLLEVSGDYDEDYKWYSGIYKVPVMVKDPDLDEIAADLGTTAAALVEKLKERFAAVEQAIADGHPERELDMDALVNYMMTQLVACNQEVNHPKSIYLYSRGEGQKWSFGPVWDYDWAFSFCFSADTPLLSLRYADAAQTVVKSGNAFFTAIAKSEPFKEAFAAKWSTFKTDVYPGLLEWIDSYAARVRVSALQDGDLWRGRMTNDDYYIGWVNDPGTFDAEVTRFKKWLADRVAYIDSHPNHGFYDE